KIKKDIPEIDSAKVFLNAIHTHNAPGTFDWKGWWEPDSEAVTTAEYHDFLIDKLSELIAEAWQNKEPAGIAAAFASARVGHCRAAMYADGTSEMYGDTARVDFIGLEGSEDSGVEPCPSQVYEAGRKVSSDFMGALREKLKVQFGSDFKTLPQISAAGCQAPRDLPRNYKSDEPAFWFEEDIDAIADRLLKAVNAAYERVRDKAVYDDIELKHKVCQLNLPRRHATEEEYKEACGTVARLEAIKSVEETYKDFVAEVTANEKTAGRPGPYDSKLHNFVLIQNAKAVVTRYNEQNEKPNCKFTTHVVRLGNIVFASNPFELYLAYGQQMKARSRAQQTFVIQLTSGYSGYLPTEFAEERGAYGSLIINGQLGSDSGKKLVDETIAAVDSLFNE
ncbi:MAG: hypothetical protein ACYTFY_05185, partial [Planctomycetota bacterium]